MNNLDVYNKLRDIHNILKNLDIDLQDYELNDWEINALEAIDSVLYLCEGVFSNDKILKKVGK